MLHVPTKGYYVMGGSGNRLASSPLTVGWLVGFKSHPHTLKFSTNQILEKKEGVECF